MAIGESIPKRVESIRKLQSHLAAIAKRIQSDPRFAAAAAVNPLVALEEMGIELTEAVRDEIVRRGSYSNRQFLERERVAKQLETQGVDIAGANLLDDGSVRQLLRDRLGIPDKAIPADLTVHRALRSKGRRARSKVLKFEREISDPLEAIAADHAAIPLLMRLREIDARARPFGSRELYEAVRSGKIALPVSNLRARLRSGDGRNG